MEVVLKQLKHALLPWDLHLQLVQLMDLVLLTLSKEMIRYCIYFLLDVVFLRKQTQSYTPDLSLVHIHEPIPSGKCILETSA